MIYLLNMLQISSSFWPIFSHSLWNILMNTKFSVKCSLIDFFLLWLELCICLLRNLYAGQEATVCVNVWQKPLQYCKVISLQLIKKKEEATVRTGHGTTDWFQIGRGVHQGCILSPCLFNLYAEHIMRNAGLDGLQAGIKTGVRNINHLRYVDDTILMAESKEELKSLLRIWKRRVKKLT